MPNQTTGGPKPSTTPTLTGDIKTSHTAYNQLDMDPAVQNILSVAALESALACPWTCRELSDDPFNTRIFH